MVPVLTAESSSRNHQGEAISAALAERRESLRLRLLAAGVRSEDVEGVIFDAIDSVKADSWLSSNPGRRLVQAVDTICEGYAQARAIPYRPILRLFQRLWTTIDSRMTEAGLSPLARETVLRTLVRTLGEKTWTEAAASPDLLLSRVDAICSAHSRCYSTEDKRLAD